MEAIIFAHGKYPALGNVVGRGRRATLQICLGWSESNEQKRLYLKMLLPD
jgi:hypothetical protein